MDANRYHEFIPINNGNTINIALKNPQKYDILYANAMLTITFFCLTLTSCDLYMSRLTGIYFGLKFSVLFVLSFAV